MTGLWQIAVSRTHTSVRRGMASLVAWDPGPVAGR
jgi:hypothetical protein